ADIVPSAHPTRRPTLLRGSWRRPVAISSAVRTAQRPRARIPAHIGSGGRSITVLLLDAQCWSQPPARPTGTPAQALRAQGAPSCPSHRSSPPAGRRGTPDDGDVSLRLVRRNPARAACR